MNQPPNDPPKLGGISLSFSAEIVPPSSPKVVESEEQNGGEQKATEDAPPPPPKEYGLKLMKPAGETVSAAPRAPPPRAPLLLRNRPQGLDDIEDEKERFKKDMESRPDEASSERYEDVPVEQFGEAILRGMGWSEENRGIGLSGKVVKPIEYVPRHHRLGLGAQPALPKAPNKKFIKPGESREAKPIMVLPKDADGHQRHYKTMDEKLVPLKIPTIEPGAFVAIVAGVHEGMAGRITAMDKEASKINVKLASEEIVEVHTSEVILLNATCHGHDRKGRGTCEALIERH